MWQTRRFALFAVVLSLLASGIRQVSARSSGAPIAACGDLTQQHFTSPASCDRDCPFSVSLVAVDGTPVAAGAVPQTYKCGSEHTLRIATSDPDQTFRGFAIQARESTETFSNDASFLGEFVNAPTGGDWKIWSCDADSATHTSPSDKTSVDVTWRAPANFGPNVTMWFSITRVFSNFHAQLKGLELSPDGQCPPTGTLRFACAFEAEGQDIVARSCEAEGFIPASFQCQIDDQPRFPCTSPFRFSRANITGVGVHTLRVIANTFFPDSVASLESSSRITIQPSLDCTPTQSGTILSVQCTPNDQPDSVSCSINGESFTPCELDKIEVDASNFEAGSTNVLAISFTANGLTGQTSITFTGVESQVPFQVSCSRQISSDQSTITVECTGNRDIASQVCTLNAKDIVDCKLPLSIAVSELNPGVNTLEIVLSDAGGDTARYAANITVGGQTALTLACGATSGGGAIQVSCVAEGGEVTNVTCIYDNGAIVESCDLMTSVDLARFEPGAHTLLIIANTADGRSAQSTLRFNVAAAPFQASCDRQISADQTKVTVECNANRDIASQICILNGVEIPNCMLPLEIAVSDLMSGDNSLQIVLMDAQGTNATVSSIITIGTPITELSLSCGTSSSGNKIQVSCVAEGGEVSNVTCIYDGGDIIEACALDTSIDLLRFEAGPHTLQIIAQTADGLMGDITVQFNVSVSVMPLKLFCTVYSLPGQVDISCEASRELADLASCRLDIPGFPTEPVPCDIEIFSVTDENLPPGGYVLTIEATDVLGQSATLDVPFTLTAGVAPGFRVLSGDVLLGQRPELLNFAARSGSVISVMAADTPRTVVVQRDVAVTINGSDWFRDNPGDSTFITHTLLDKSGNEIGEPLTLPPRDFGRVLIDDESVTITRTLLVDGAEDADFSLYMFMSCMSTDDGLLENCASASVTVYPIGSAPEIDAASDDEPPTVGLAVTTTKIGADFCLNFPTRPPALQIICNDVDELGVVPLPSLSWYKDDVLAITQDSFGQPSFSEEFLNQGRNGLLRSGALSPPALIAIPTSSPSGYGDLFLNFVGLTVADAGLLPPGLNASDIDREVFSVLLGRWECRVNNSFGEDSALSELSDCAIVMFVLDCGVTSPGPSGPVRVNCFGSRDIAIVECIYDGGELVEACNFPVTVDFTRFAPGSHTLLLNVTSTGGEMATEEVTFVVPDPLVITCEVSDSPGVTNIACMASKELSLSPSCSLRRVGTADEQPIICDLAGIQLTSDLYQPGDYILIISAIDVNEQTTTVQVNLTIQGTGDSAVQCRTTIDCSGDFTLMSPRDCCVGNPDGLSFTVPGVETCQVCIVYGWFNDSITEVEQGPSISIPVGYQKGAAQAAARNLLFEVIDQPGTAKQGPAMDYTVNTARARALVSGTLSNVVVTFRVDAIAQEPDETLTLRLSPLGSAGPMGDSIFFRDNITLTIVDSDRVEITFTEDDYRTNEDGGILPVIVSKSLRIASPITLTVSPLTVAQALAAGVQVPVTIPQDNPLSPSRANLQDFNNSIITITFEPDDFGAEAINEILTPIPIIDDVINEAVEQFFVVQLSLVSSQNPAGVDSSFRSTSLGRIIDNDPIRIGFEAFNYTFIEPPISEEIVSIYLAADNEVVSEQTFLIDIEASDTLIPGAPVREATFGEDYRLLGTNGSTVVITFPPSAQRVPVDFVLLPDDIPEGDEGFFVSSTPSESPNAPIFLESEIPQTFFIILSTDPVVPDLNCFPLLGSRIPVLSCFSTSGEIDSATCAFDGGPASSCDLFGIEIDSFSFSPGEHTLLIRFNLTTGAEGVFEYEFTGEVRPPALIELIGPSAEEGGLFVIEEGEVLTLLIETSGFSYGDIPLNISLITYSDYAALGFTLEDEFSSALVPEDAASSDDLNLFATRYVVQAGAPLPPRTIQITTIADSLPEDAEGAILVLSFEESELDERDVGQVLLMRDSYLVRINESVGIQEPEVDCFVSATSGITMVMCVSTTLLVSPQTCILESDGLPMTFDCNVSSVAISVQDYPPGEYNLTIMATDIFGQSVDERVSLILAEPLIFGECRTNSISNRLAVVCNTSLDGTEVPLTYSCSYDGGPQEPCSSNFVIDFTRFEPNTLHILEVTITTLLGQELPVPPISFVVQGPELQCSEIADARLLLISCFLQGGVLDFATCSFDGGAVTRCDPGSIQIDQYSFSPGPHSLTIAFNATSGERGTFQFNFIGILRQPAVFGISSNNGIIDVSEGIYDTTFIDATGFSYGAVPIKISTLTYSEYAARGFNLENDFSPSVIPANAADAYDYVNINRTETAFAGGFVVPAFFSLQPYSEGISEQTEGFVLFFEIIESELDPRDVGNASLSRSAYLVRINDSASSNFAIQIGDIVLGPRPELLEVAARAEVVHVFVTDDVQTAIVSNGVFIRLDWLRWVAETLESLGDVPRFANYTLRRTQLDEFGNPVGPPVVVGPSEPEDRITVKFDPETREYYVEIFNTVVSAGAEDPDRAIYDLEACYLQPDASRRCVSSNITIYAIQGVQLECRSFTDDVSRIFLGCSADNFVSISSANCSFDGGPLMPCDPTSLTIQFVQFTPGPHTLTISFILADGTKGVDFQYDFTVPDRPRVQLQCQTFADNVSQVALICFANNFVNISSANCSFDGGPPMPCDPALINIDLFKFTPEPHTLTISYILMDGRRGQDFQYNFTGQVRPRVSISLASDDGLISTTEGEFLFNPVSFSGFSYGVVYVKISTLSYSEFTARGFNIEDEFAPDLIPAMSADAFDYNNTTPLIPFPGGGLVPDFMQYFLLSVYEDGLEEDREGLILLLDIPESLLDPRDVGQIDLERNVYLVTINDSETSNFRILIGEVELGPRPELLDVAVPLFTLTRAFVTDEEQTVILMNTSFVILDWSKWVSETLGDSAGGASYTLYKTQIDVLGDPVGAPEEVQPTDLDSRVIVQLNPATNEYYVQISEALSTVGAEDPDRAIYELEACVPQSDGSVQCYRSNITAYAIGLTRRPLNVECFVGATSGSVRVICESNNPLVSPQSCSLESSIAEQTFDCNAESLMFSVLDYPPGDYNLTIEVVDVFGQIQYLSYSFFLPEPFLFGQCILDRDQLSVFCNTSLDDTLVPFTYTCSYNSEPAEPCSSDFFIDPLRFGVGDHTLDVTIATEFGQVLNIPGLAFEYEGPLTPTLECPEVADTQLITIDCSSLVGGLVEFSTCSFDGDVATPCDVEFLEIDQFSFSPGPHTLTIAFNLTTGREGEFQYNFTGLVRPPAVFELPSAEGVIDILEGGEYEEELIFSGFSYSTVPIRVYSLTYSEYADRGFNLQDDFDSNVIPANAADAYDYEQVDTTLPGLAGDFVDPPSLSVETYQDGIAEQSEGFVLFLEIAESELDPRDLGSVSLSRSVYLVRINQSDTSNFRVLIGDVELGQDRPELLEVAAVEEERVRVFVTDEAQTAIVTNEAAILLDWFRWVTETLGDSAINATYTALKIELDENGEPDDEIEEIESSDRIEVEFESDEEEYYIKISRVIAREMDDEDPDSAIYVLEACVPQSDGSEQCYKSNVTVFAIQVIELECSEQPDTRLLTLSCVSPGNVLNDSANCSFDGGPATPCFLLFLEIDQYSFSPGPHTLNIAFTVNTGEQGEFVYEFTGLVREPAVFRFSSVRGSLDISEGILYEDLLQSSGFTYGAVPIRINTLTYSEFADEGFNLEDSFDSSAIPSNAASAFDYKAVDTTISGYAGGNFSSPSLTLDAYQDGEAEQLEGFILYLAIEESDLDPRDVGNVSLSRSAYLVRINQSDTSNFQVLIGDVELGQDIPGLLDVAAMEGDRVRVFVSDDIQTAVVTDGAYVLLDWLRWVTETLGDSAVNATFTITSTELDEDGNPEEGPEEVESNDRIEAEFEWDENEYYVKITRVVARKTAEYDPDRNIYNLEACVPQSDGSETCYNSNITVFAIDTLPPVEPLGIVCSVRGVTGMIRVSCESNNPLESPEFCTLESPEEESFNFSCNAASLVISVNDYPPGEYNLTIEAVDIFDQTASEVFTIFLPEPLLVGACFHDDSDLTVSCNTTLDETQVELEYLCSYDSGPFESCGPNFGVDGRLAIGVHTLDITISTEFGQVLRVLPLTIVIPELSLLCFPELNQNFVSFSCSSPGREIDTATCSIDDGPATPCDITFYMIDQFTFSPGPHVITVMYNVTSGRMGEFLLNFTGEVRPPVVISELLSDDGIIDIAEGESYSSPLFLSGFSYGDIPLKISTLTYSEYAAGGYNLADDFDPSLIPMDAADDYDYQSSFKPISSPAGSAGAYELSIDAYLDGVAEEMEGFIIYLDLMESELDPRDVGQVNLSRSVYLVVINQSDTSNFQVLIGDVELGQDIPGLLDVAARDGDRVRVFVTDETQTAIATDEAYILLDWFRWVTETLGDSVINATYTLYRTQLNEAGEPLGPAEVVNASTDRIEIEFEFDEEEYYVKITEVVAREGEEEVPDRATYELEACIPTSGDNMQCFRSGVTVYAIDTTPQLELLCSPSGFDGRITVSCESNNPLIFPQSCTPLPLEVSIMCNASSFTLSIDDFPPGAYNFTIDSTDVFGQTATTVVELFLPEPLLIGSCVATSPLYILCNTTLDQTQVPLEYTCSYDSGPPEPCGPNFVIDRNRFSPGPHILDVTITTLFGQILSVPSIAFNIEVLPVVELQCSEIALARVLTLSCSSPSGPIETATCSFDGRPPILCELGALEIDSFAFSPGFHAVNISFITTGGQGSFLYNFTGQVRPSVEIELFSDEGVIDVNEGVLSFNFFSTEGFSYGPFAITLSIFTYSEFEERGYNLADSFESDEIPANAANDYDYNSTLGRQATIVFDPVGGAGLIALPPPLGIFPYIDGLAEEPEGLVVYLDLEESDLDPRDAGQVALERSTYLVRINPSTTSTFEIIIGDVELGQRPELLEKSAQPGTEVLAFVTEDQQTAVAAHGSRIRLDWSQWVEDELGSSASEANYTIYRTGLNETGGVQGPPEVLQPTPSDRFSRVVVRIDPETNEFYVDVSSVSVLIAAEDPDSAIYELEACYFEDDGSKDCERTSITLYAIGQAPILISADEDDEPEETSFGLRSPVGAEFCLSFDTDRKVLLLTCGIEQEDTIAYPQPERLWYKDGVLVYSAEIGESPEISDEFFQTGNNSLLRLGVISPPPLIALGDGSLTLDWSAVNLTLPDELPDGVTAETFRMEVFKTLLGEWECELENSLGESEAETTLSDCATDDVDLECESSIGSVFASILECEAEFELVDIQCTIDGTPLANCSFPLTINRLDFSEDEHVLRVTVRDSRGMTDTFELQFNGALAGNLPALSVDFKVLDDPQSPGSGASRVVFLPEASTTSSVVSIEVAGGDTVAPIPFHVLPLTYDEFEARYPNTDLSDLFPMRPRDPAGDSDFNTNSLTFIGPSEFSPDVVLPDLIPELNEGFIIFLEVDRANTDPRDLSRIQFLNRHILAVIEDDDALVTCNANVMDDEVIVNCPGIDGLPPDNNYQCSVDFAPPESCLFPYEIARSSVVPGRHNIRLFQRRAGEPIPDQILGGAQFQIDPLSIRFVNNTPVMNAGRIYAEIEISRPGVSMECHLTHLSGPRMDCSNGRVEFTGVPSGDFTLRVVAVDPFISDRLNPDRREIARNRLWVPAAGDNEVCVTYVRNDAVSVNQNTMTIDFASTGNPTGFLCSFDRGEFFECSSPYTRDSIPIGRHRIKVVPQGCGRNFHGYTTRFDVI